VQRGFPRPHRAWSLVRHLRTLRPDVVQTWAYHADLCGGIAARLAGSLGLVWNIRHGTLDPAMDSRNTLRSAHLCARLSKSVPTKIRLNSHAALAVHEEAGYDPSKMHVIPNGFDTQRQRDEAMAQSIHELVSAVEKRSENVLIAVGSAHVVSKGFAVDMLQSEKYGYVFEPIERSLDFQKI